MRCRERAARISSIRRRSSTNRSPEDSLYPLARRKPNSKGEPMKTALRRFAPLIAAAVVAAPAWAQKTELLVYTALETDQLKAYTESFQKTNPNIDLKFVRDSTGVITAKSLAEKANPQA